MNFILCHKYPPNSKKTKTFYSYYPYIDSYIKTTTTLKNIPSNFILNK